ncbi:MAG: hypothetical protein RSB82_02420 [Victivallaceae bacterium]
MDIPYTFFYDMIFSCLELSVRAKEVPVFSDPIFQSQIFGLSVWGGHSKGILILKFLIKTCEGPDFIGNPKKIELFFDFSNCRNQNLLKSQTLLYRFHCMPLKFGSDSKDNPLLKTALYGHSERNSHKSGSFDLRKDVSLGETVVLFRIPLLDCVYAGEQRNRIGFAFRLISDHRKISFPFEEKSGFLLEDNSLFWSFFFLNGTVS